MKTYYCWHCGAPITFSRRRKRPDGTFEYRIRAFPVHINGGPCTP